MWASCIKYRPIPARFRKFLGSISSFKEIKSPQLRSGGVIWLQTLIYWSICWTNRLTETIKPDNTYWTLKKYPSCAYYLKWIFSISWGFAMSPLRIYWLVCRATSRMKPLGNAGFSFALISQLFWQTGWLTSIERVTRQTVNVLSRYM